MYTVYKFRTGTGLPLGVVVVNNTTKQLLKEVLYLPPHTDVLDIFLDDVETHKELRQLLSSDGFMVYEMDVTKSTVSDWKGTDKELLYDVSDELMATLVNL